MSRFFIILVALVVSSTNAFATKNLTFEPGTTYVSLADRGISDLSGITFPEGRAIAK